MFARRFINYQLNVTDLGHWTNKRKEDEDLDAPISGKKKYGHFGVGNYAGDFGSEDMPAISGQKICRQFRVGRYAGNFGSENMPAISGRKKNDGNV